MVSIGGILYASAEEVIYTLNTATGQATRVASVTGQPFPGLVSLAPQLVTGYVNPKYLIMGVTYAPPGGNSLSFVSYQNSNLVGNTSTISSSFQNGVSQTTTISASAGPNLSDTFGFKGGASITQTNAWTQKTTNSNSLTINKTNATTFKTPGVPNVYSPVDHDYDIIWLWLNPVALFTVPEASASGGGYISWNGYGFDASDPLQDLDVWPVYVGYLNGDFGPLDPQDVGALSRSWVTTQTFAPGQSPAITMADYANILGADPFAYNPFDSNSGYVLNVSSGTNPPTSVDGRFTAPGAGNATPQSVPYQQAPLGSTVGLQETYQLTNQTTNTSTQALDYTYAVTLGVEVSLTEGFVWASLTDDLKQTWTMTWENVSTTSTMATNTQTDTAQITGPPCPATTPPCNPQYTEPHEFAIYQDNLYGTFMFWPNPYFSIASVVPATKTIASGGTANYAISTLANAGYTGTSISINVTGLPTGATFTPVTGTPGTNFTLSIATTSSTPSGTYLLTISAVGGSQSYFAYASLVVSPAASLTSLSPMSATAGGPSFTLTINGSGFLSGSTVQWNGSSTGISTTYVGASQLTASVPAALIASAGNVSVTVVSGGAPSNALTFTIGSPMTVISGLSPSSATAGAAAFTLTVNGSGFLSGSVVNWGGSPVPTSYVSASQLSASISAPLIASPGNVCITVVNMGEGASNCATFSVGASSTPNVLTISHIADGGGWRSSIILTNTDVVPALYTVSFWSDAGASYTPPLSSGSTTGSIPVGGSTIIETADTTSTLSEGWAQVSSSQSIGGAGIFRYDPWSQEAAVPLLTTGGIKLEIPFQIGNGLSLGIALANPNATQAANITEIIRDQNGNEQASRTLSLPALNHTAFNPTIPGSIVGGGTVEYDSTVNIFGLGIRSAPEGNALAFTSVDADLPLAASAKTISHIADGGGWRSGIILVNTDTVPAFYTVNFRDDSGNSYVPPLASGATAGSLPVGGSTIIETADTAPALAEGWAEVTSSQSVGGSAIFRYDPWAQEAAVPLLTAGGTALEVPYQIGDGLALGIALANPSATQTANVTEIIRDQNGNQEASRTLTLPPLSHTAFNPTIPGGVVGGGVVEYDSNTDIFALGIRAAPEGTGLAFTSVPAAYK
jgi:hypothetical protein